MDLKEIGAKIKARRSYLRLSQRELGEQIGTSRSNIAKYEAGDVDLNLSTMETLCSALSVSMSYFYPADEDEWAPEGEVAAFYRGMPPDQQSVVRAMIKAAHDEIKRAETTHGRKAE